MGGRVNGYTLFCLAELIDHDYRVTIKREFHQDATTPSYVVWIDYPNRLDAACHIEDTLDAAARGIEVMAESIRKEAVANVCLGG